MNILVGQRILHYKIIAQIGQGGMGVVYKAEDTKLKREVALKFLPHYITSNQEERKRFEIEAQAAASLNHPNISTIYSIEEADNEVFIVMEYIDGVELKYKINATSFPSETIPGQTLSENGDRGGLKIDEAVSLALQIAEGLEAAHKKGVVHRDVKSSNILITREGKVKIMDFGLAKIKGVQITKTSSTLGTIGYISPEQAIGNEIDHRTDIWSFGVLLYEMLSGQLPFKGDYEQAVIYLILNEEPAPINIKGKISEELNSIITKCLNKERDKRFNSFEEIIKKFNELRGDSPVIKGENSFDEEIFSFSNEVPQKSDLLVGRDKYVTTVKSVINQVKNNKGKTLLISGETGIGKTQFISHTIRHYRNSDFTVLYGRCLVNNEGGLPYHPFVNAIKNNSAYSDKSFINYVSGSANRYNINLSERIPLVKKFLNQTGDLSNTLMHKEQLWDTMLIIFKIISLQKPLILILDDLHWADKATLDFFSFLARNISGIPIFLVGIYRPPETVVDFDTRNLTDVIRQLRIEDLAEKIELERLSEKETGEVIKKILEDKHLDKKIREKIFRQSGGNPLFVYELANLLKDKELIELENDKWLFNSKTLVLVSEKVQDVIKQRIDYLDVKTIEILQVASCEGEYFHSDILSVCLNINRIELLKLLQSLEKGTGIIRSENKYYRFDHILIREVLYNSIIPELKEEYHRMIAGWLIDNYKDYEEYACRTAHHLVSSGEEKRAIDYLVKAADRAKDLYAIEEALNYYKKIYDIIEKFKIDRIDVMISSQEGLGDTYISLGKLEEAIIHYKQFLNLADSKNLKPELTKALRKLAECFRVKGEMDTAEKFCNDAISFAKDIDDKKELLESINTLAFINANRGDYKKTIELSNQVLQLSNEYVDPKNRSISLSNLGFAFWHLGNYPSAVEKFNEALTIQRSIGDNRGLSTTLNFLGLAYWKLGNYQQGLECSLESVEIKKSIADYRKIPGSLNSIGDIYRDIGDIEKAINYHQRSLALSTEHQNKGSMCDNIRDLGEDYFLIDDFEKAYDYYKQVLELAGSSGIKWYETRAYISLSELFLFIGKLQEAKEYISNGLKFSYEIGAKDLIIEGLWKDASIKAEEGYLNESVSRLNESVKIAEEVGHKTFLWKLLFDLGGILIGQNEITEAKAYIENSKIIVQDIAGSLKQEELKNIFLNSKKVRKLFEVQI